MLETKGQTTSSIEGIDQQDFSKIQLLNGAYPNKVGLQQRIPGKTLIRQQTQGIGGIGVMYNVYGRFYNIINFGSIININPVIVGSITQGALPPNSNLWYDDFSGYSSGLISLIWGAGIWPNTFGICQTIINGILDPFQIYATVSPISGGPVPITPPPPPTSPQTTPADPNSPAAMYPPGSAQVILIKQTALANNSCTGQGTEPLTTVDSIQYFDYAGGTLLDTLLATSIPVGKVTVWNGLRVGRLPDLDLGLVAGTCPGPPEPQATVYYLIETSGAYGIES